MHQIHQLLHRPEHVLHGVESVLVQGDYATEAREVLPEEVVQAQALYVNERWLIVVLRS